MHDEEETKQQDEQQEVVEEEKAERPHFTLEVHDSKMGSRTGFVKEEEKQDG